ncbi:MAG: hypothetical protein R2794_09610 [Chitinophagales bacterium]
MIISHTYKYVFVELPQTASSAIARELRENYDGHEILFKHALYSTDFLKQANAEEKQYKVISGLRNPMDICVSNYFKFRTDHENRYSQPRLMRHGLLRKYIMRWWNVRQYKSIVEKGEDFEGFFMRAYTLPYASWSIIEHKRFDHIIRFERLNADFAEALRILNIEKVRDIPVANKTAEKTKTFWEYYASDKAKRRAKFIFGPYMQRWGYAFPESWSKFKIPWYAFVLYHTVNAARIVFWKFLR